MENENTIVVDADFFMFYICFPKKDKPEIELSEAKMILDKYIKNIMRMTNADKYIMCLTVGKCFRYDINPDYKGNRKYPPKPKAFDGLKEYLIVKYKATYGWGLEADDMVNIYKNKYPDYIIVSPDKDILKCIKGKHFNPKRNVFVETTEEEAHTNFWRSMITGDTIDNIKGIPGKGDKFVDRMSIVNPITVLTEYIVALGEEKGIEEYYKNFKMLKILDVHDKMEFVEPIKL